MTRRVAEDVAPLSLEAKRAQLGGLIKWAGGKASLARVLLPAIRARRPKRLIEPFAGGAALFFRLKLPGSVLGDTNTHLMRFYLAVKRNPKKVRDALEAIKRAASQLHGPKFGEFYYELREQFPRSELYENAAMFLFLNRHCWNGLYRENLQGKFNTPIGSYESLQALPDLAQLEEASDVLKSATLRTGDFTETFGLARPGDLVYCDPPYIPISSTARFSNYQGQAFSWRDHVRLKKALYDLQERGIDFMLSNSFQRLTVSFYSDFRQYTVKTAGTISARSVSRQARQELIVTSFVANVFEAKKNA
jgi:DNA adenine methylase